MRTSDPEEVLDEVVDRVVDLVGAATREKFGAAIDRFGLRAVMLAVSLAEERVPRPKHENWILATLEGMAREEALPPSRDQVAARILAARADFAKTRIFADRSRPRPRPRETPAKPAKRRREQGASNPPEYSAEMAARAAAAASSSWYSAIEPAAIRPDAGGDG